MIQKQEILPINVEKVAQKYVDLLIKTGDIAEATKQWKQYLIDNKDLLKGIEMGYDDITKTIENQRASLAKSNDELKAFTDKYYTDIGSSRKFNPMSSLDETKFPELFKATGGIIPEMTEEDKQRMNQLILDIDNANKDITTSYDISYAARSDSQQKSLDAARKYELDSLNVKKDAIIKGQLISRGIVGAKDSIDFTTDYGGTFNDAFNMIKDLGNENAGLLGKVLAFPESGDLLTNITSIAAQLWKIKEFTGNDNFATQLSGVAQKYRDYTNQIEIEQQKIKETGQNTMVPIPAGLHMDGGPRVKGEKVPLLDVLKQEQKNMIKEFKDFQNTATAKNLTLGPSTIGIKFSTQERKYLTENKNAIGEFYNDIRKYRDEALANLPPEQRQAFIDTFKNFKFPLNGVMQTGPDAVDQDSLDLALQDLRDRVAA